MNTDILIKARFCFNFLQETTRHTFKNKEWIDIMGLPSLTFAAKNISGCVTPIGDEAYVSFEGSNDTVDYLMDAFFFKAPYKQDGKVRGAVHTGFMVAWDRVKEDVFECIEKVDPNKEKVYTCIGHSLGASLAVLLMDDLVSRGYKIKDCYTAGAPRMGGLSAVKWFESRFTIYRFVNNFDLVPGLLSWKLWYFHAGKGFFMRYGKVRENGSYRYMFWNYFVKWFSEHGIVKYLKEANKWDLP